jgi:hypothetical protein
METESREAFMTNPNRQQSTRRTKMKNKFQWISETEIEKAKMSDKKCCKMCRYDGVPGFIINALQWVRCWGCGK